MTREACPTCGGHAVAAWETDLSHKCGACLRRWPKQTIHTRAPREETTRE